MVQTIGAGRATLTKLVRVTMLAPYLIMLVLTAHRKAQVSIAKLLPLFIWGFLALAALNTLGLLPVLTFHPLGGVERQTSMAAVLNDASTLLLASAADAGLSCYTFTGIQVYRYTGMSGCSTRPLPSVLFCASVIAKKPMRSGRG